MLRPPIGTGAGGKLYAAALSPDGRRLAVGGYGGRRRTDSHDLPHLPAGRPDRARPRRAHQRDPSRSPSPPTASGSPPAAATTPPASGTPPPASASRRSRGTRSAIYGVAFSPDGTRLATGVLRRHGPRLGSSPPARPWPTLKGHDKEVRCVAWSRTARPSPPAATTSSIRLWDAGRHPPQDVRQTAATRSSSVAFTADGKELLFTRAGRARRCLFACWTSASGKERVRFDRHNNTVYARRPVARRHAGGHDRRRRQRDLRLEDGRRRPRLPPVGRGQAHVRRAGWGTDGTAIAWGMNRKGGRPPEADTPLDRTFRLGRPGVRPRPGRHVPPAAATLGSLSLKSRTARPSRPAGRARRSPPSSLSNEYDGSTASPSCPATRSPSGPSYGLDLFDARSGKQLRKFLGHTGDRLGGRRRRPTAASC